MTNQNLEQKTGQMPENISPIKKNSYLDALNQIFSISDSIFSSSYNTKNKKNLSSSYTQPNNSCKFYSLFAQIF